ncbi:hypothetical protein LOC54_04815 [Acetobacter sp. AN02]|uniref:hypothetical protein n=1 Tax=Acetobacter sp. AN02 TaxID=2894186 RepID=UPI0024343F37|nr:hypothetical protein [Acetobacter sp. AN02]MDG6094441.1 hypothetical protein [Acetobacter sp. AN02]
MARASTKRAGTAKPASQTKPAAARQVVKAPARGRKKAEPAEEVVKKVATKAKTAAPTRARKAAEEKPAPAARKRAAATKASAPVKAAPVAAARGRRKAEAEPRQLSAVEKLRITQETRKQKRLDRLAEEKAAVKSAPARKKAAGARSSRKS